MNKLKWSVLVLILFMVVMIIWNNVPKTLTKEDHKALTSLNLGNKNIAISDLHFSEEIKLITSIQAIIHSEIYLGGSIPYSSPREPKDLIKFGTGLCYDFSRTIEKSLMSYGFKTRHIAIYSNPSDENGFQLLLRKQTPSHSTLEVKTSKGWMIVDSNYEWIGLSNDSLPVSFNHLCAFEGSTIFNKPIPAGYDEFYNCNSIGIYGLYSRHGKFFPPYNFIPDFNFREILYNL